MGDVAPGWYEDDEDGRLARWWDGEAWTGHTVVIAEQPPGVEPPPPPPSGTRFPVPPPAHEWLDDPAYAEDDDDELGDALVAPLVVEAPRAEGGLRAWPPIREAGEEWHRLDDPAAEPAPKRSTRHRRPSHERRRRILVGEATLGDRVRELPTWLRVVAPVAAVLLAVGAVASAGALRSDDGGTGGSTLTDGAQPDPQRLRAAADVALQTADVSWFTRQGFMASIPPTCAAAEDDDPQRVADRIVLLGYDDITAGRLVAGLEAGTEAFCPAEIGANPGFFEDVFRLAGADPAATSTTIAAPDVTTTVAPSTTTRSTPTPTTARRSTPAPTTPPTQPPATTVPPTTTTAAPTTTSPPETTTTAPVVGG